MVTTRHVDNLHVSSVKRGEGEKAISTPGAFHALHCHWRWGAITGDPNADKSILPAAGRSQFTGLGWTKARGGPLIAYELPRQNISGAVTRNDAAAWRKEDNPSTREFISLFTDVRGVPDVIAKGDDLVLWFSFGVSRDDDQLDKPSGGTLFVNGMYFAHNKDATPVLLRVAGAYGEASYPTPKQAWVRKAR